MRCAPVALQTDQKIVAAGYSITSAGVNQFLVARYTTAGVLDPAFNYEWYGDHHVSAPMRKQMM